MKKICMIVQDPMVKGGIAAVVNGYRGSKLEKEFEIIYVESYKDGGKLTKLFKALFSYFNFFKVMITNKPNLVHIHSSFGPSFYRKIPFIYIADFFKIPIINHIHGADFETFYTNASNNKKALIKKIYGKCSILIVLSDEWKEKFEIIMPKEKVTVVENYSIIQEDLNRERDIKNRVLFLGEIGYRKGCYDIPYVIKNVQKEISDVQFILGGSGDIDEIKALVKQNKVEKNVIFPGWVRGKQKDMLLRDCDLFFLPSYNEGMPMSILDAMGYSLPIISTNVGGIPKIVKNGFNGYCFEPGDIDGFSKCIVELLKSKSTIQQYGNASYEIVKNRYSIEYHLKLIEKLYKSF